MSLHADDESAIRDLVRRDADAVRRMDWPGVVACFTEDALRFPPHQSPIRGREAILAWLSATPPIEQFAITADDIGGDDDLAYVRGTYRITIRPIGAVEPITDRGNYIGIVRKQADGQWLWAIDMMASELPPPSAATR